VIVAGVAALLLGDGTSGSGLPQAAVSGKSTIAHTAQTRIRLILPDRAAKRPFTCTSPAATQVNETLDVAV
jgi:hypothetical protein